MKKIKLKNSDKFIFVDDDNYTEIVLLSEWSGHFNNNGDLDFVMSTKQICGRRILLGRFILGCVKPNGLDVDHKDCNVSNFQKSNLRWATRQQNQANKPKQKNNTSGYKGVSFDKSNFKWKAYIRFNGTLINIGYFKTAEEASFMYNKKAIELFGEFSKT